MRPGAQRRQFLAQNHTASYSGIFVDEFQDINYGQYRLLKLLAPPKADICVIGDPDQAIYGFRGSDVRYFNQFLKDYPKTRVMQLSRNYRSVETILQSSHQVICGRSNGSDNLLDGAVRQRVYSNVHGHETISILECATARAEAVAIGKTIETMVGGTVSRRRFRQGGCTSNRFPQLRRRGCFIPDDGSGSLLDTVLTEAGIPCLAADSDAWRKNRAVAKLLALLRVLTNQGSSRT